MFKLPILFFVAAIIAAVLGFSGIAEAASDIAIILFLVFGVLFVLSLVFGGAGRTLGGFTGALGGVATMAAVAFIAVWFSDQYSLETAGANLDESLAAARADLDEVVSDLPGATRDAREEIAEALGDAEDAVDPDEGRVE
jgi:uncharacterized membrane protein YtjA (UPF0391 family)